MIIAAILTALLLTSGQERDVTGRHITHTKAEAVAALDGMIREIETCFPDEDRLKTEEWKTAVAETRAALTDGMSGLALQDLFQRLVVHLHDGHTMVAHTFLTSPRQIRLALTYFDGSLVAWAVFTPDVPAGSKITQIGDRTAAEALEWMLRRTSHDDREAGLRNAAAALPTSRDLFPEGKNTLTVHYLGPNGKPGQAVFQRPIDPDRGTETTGQRVTSRRKPLPWWPDGADQTPFRFRIVERDDRPVAGYLRIARFASRETPGASDRLPSFERTLKDLFQQMNDEGVKTLIVDVRDNPGGDSSLTQMLLAHFAKERKTLKGFGAVRRVSERYLEQRPAHRDIVPKEFQGKYWQPGGSGMAISPAEPFFAGRLILLTNPGTFSSAEMLAAVVKDNELGTIVGEPTAGSAVGLGDVLRIPLSIKQLTLYVSSTRWTRPDQSGDRPNVVLPDVPAPQTYESYVHDRDDALEKALDLAAGTTQP